VKNANVAFCVRKVREAGVIFWRDFLGRKFGVILAAETLA